MMKKYEQVEHYILEKIESGTFPVGSKIPSEDELIERLQVSRNPVRRALENLMKDGVVYKIQGSGSFVKDVSIPQAIDLYAILPSESFNLESAIIEGMRKALDDNHHKHVHLILQRPGKNTMEQIDILNLIPKDRKGGIIFLPAVSVNRAANRLLAAHIRKFEKAQFPVIQVDNYIPEYEGNYIITDHRKASCQMTEYLLSMGHKHIAVLYQNQHKPSVKLRLQGIKQAYEQQEIAPTMLHRFDLSGKPITREFVEELLESGCSAVFGLECGFIYDLYRQCLSMGLEIPKDLSLCSFDNHSYPPSERDFFAAVIQKLNTIGYYSVQILLDLINKKTQGNIELLINAQLHQGRSIGKIT